MSEFTNEMLLALSIVLRSSRKQGFIEFEGDEYLSAIAAELEIKKEIVKRKRANHANG